VSDETGNLPPAPRPNRATRRRDQRVRRVETNIRPDISDDPVDRRMWKHWAQLEVTGDTIYARLVAEGVVRSDGTPHPLISDLVRVRRAQAQIANQLGLGPRGRAEIQALPRAIDMDGAFERIERAHKERHGEEVVEDVEPQTADEN
jgi:hypothetical protein